MTSYLSRKELAAELRVSTDTIDSLRAAGEIPAKKLGRIYRFDLDAVLKALDDTRDPWARPSRRKLRRSA